MYILYINRAIRQLWKWSEKGSHVEHYVQMFNVTDCPSLQLSKPTVPESLQPIDLYKASMFHFLHATLYYAYITFNQQCLGTLPHWMLVLTLVLGRDCGNVFSWSSNALCIYM